MYHTDNVFDIYGMCGSKNKRPKFGLRFLLMRGNFFSFFLISRVLLDEPFPQCRKLSYVDTKWLDHLTLFSQDRRLYLKKRNAAIVIACYVRGWKVGSISVMEVTGEKTELSFPFSSRREVAIQRGC